MLTPEQRIGDAMRVLWELEGDPRDLSAYASGLVRMARQGDSRMAIRQSIANVQVQSLKMRLDKGACETLVDAVLNVTGDSI